MVPKFLAPGPTENREQELIPHCWLITSLDLEKKFKAVSLVFPSNWKCFPYNCILLVKRILRLQKSLCGLVCLICGVVFDRGFQSSLQSQPKCIPSERCLSKELFRFICQRCPENLGYMRKRKGYSISQSWVALEKAWLLIYVLFKLIWWQKYI